LFKISKKVTDRISSTLKGFQTIAASHKTRDVSEADTVTLVKDILSACFGFDKYQELTSEQQIRGTFCDLAVKIDGTIKYLIEVKAAGVSLNDSHLRQAIAYGASEGIEWVVLTNAVEWRLHRIKFGQPVETEEVSAFSFVDLSAKSEDDLNKMFLLCREGIGSGAMNDYHQHAQILNRFTVAQVILAEPVVAAIRKELRRLFSDIKVDQDQILDILSNDVLKREVIEGDKPKETQQKMKKLSAKLARLSEKKTSSNESVASETPATAGDGNT
jgi:Type I restriction enzyme R protein N terminus (HSDR_N)